MLRKRRAILFVLSTCSAILLTLSLSGCGGGKGGAVSLGPAPPATVTPAEETAAPVVRANSLAEAIQQVESAQVPLKVDPALFGELQAELVRVIKETAEKDASIPATGERNEVSDLVLSGNDTDGWRLEWMYVNVGDYNLDGLVSVNDLTPIGQYYECAAGDLDWLKGQNADGNSDGLITVSDITPIGQNFQAFISGFNIYGAAAPEGPWELVDSIARPDPPEEGAFIVSHDLVARDHESYRVVSCDSDSLEGQESAPCGYIPEPAEVTLGADTLVSTQTIGTAGGTISAPGGSPIEGASIVFPPDALPEDTVVSLGYNDGTVDLPIGELALPILVIDVGDVYEFDEPAQITVPFTGNEDMIPLAFYIHEDGSLDGMQALEIDYEGDAFTFETFHASRFIIGYCSGEWGPLTAIAVGYCHSTDEFWVKNEKTAYTDGNCMGMSIFSMWYWKTVKLGETDGLYRSFRDVVSWQPPVRFSQDMIATRAQLAVHRYSKDYAPAIVGRGYVASHQYNYNAIINMFEITASPQVVVLDSEAGRHVVLVSGIALPVDNPDLTILCIYDPNFPSDMKRLDYIKSTKSFKPYTSGATTYTKFIHFGTGTIRYAESFDNILVDANQNFNSSADATIEINSHTNGEIVTTMLADISGYVHSGEALVEKLSITNGTEVVEVELGVNGEFREDVPMHEGTNYLSFHTQGYNEDNQLVTIPNNLLTDGFTLIGEIPLPAQLTITSHTNGEEVCSQQTQVTGSIISDQIQVDQVQVFINGKGPSIAAVDGGGQFAADLTLYYGENRLEFNLYGLVEGEQAGIPHNLTTPFILTAEFAGLPIYAIDITLHIDPRLDLASANSINLYVIDPTGDCCWDGDRTTDDGGRLYSSFDTTHNPTCYYQRFWLGYDDTVRWGEGYKVRAQWREDMQYSGSHIEPPAYYEVLIALCAGYETEEITYLSGEIEGPHDWWNNECDATGPDWVDIAVVSPTQP